RRCAPSTWQRCTPKLPSRRRPLWRHPVRSGPPRILIGMIRRLAAYCYSHRWRVVIAWVVLLVGVNVLAQTVGGDLLKTFNLPGSESQRAFDALGRDFARKGDTGDLVFKVRGAGAVTSPQV